MKQSIALNGYTLHLIPCKKFKTITMSLKLKNELTKETTTKRTLLSFLLTAGTSKHPSTQAFSTYLEDMYGMHFNTNIGSKGMSQIINISSTCVNQDFLPNKEPLLEKQIQLMNDVLNHPNIVNHLFDQKSFEIKKKELKERLKANRDDKFTYSLERLFQTMGEDDYLGISSNGYEKEIDAITNKEMVDYLKECLIHDEKHMYVVGDFNDNIISLFKENMSFESDTKDIGSSIIFKSPRTKPQEIIERQDITQSKLNIGYTIDCDFISQEHYAFTVFNALFGGFSQSKLFRVVREENSLCYYISSSYDAFNGIMIVNAGIEEKDYQKTCDLVDEQLKKIQAGDFSDHELEIAQIMLKSALVKTNDDPMAMISLAFNRDITHKKETNDEYLEKLMNVSREDIINVSKKIKLDTIYLLTGKES